MTTASAHAQGGRFENEIAAFESQDRLRPPPVRPHLFVGSSSIRMWSGLAASFPDLPVLNRGFGGSEMLDLLHYFDRVVLPYAPGLVWVYEGDNDLASGKSAAVVAGSYEIFLDRVRDEMPGTEVVLMAVKPSPSRIGLLNAQRDLNSRLQALADSRPGVCYVDLFHPLLDDTDRPRPELYASDALHLSSAGYAVWEQVVRRFYEERSGVVTRTVLIDFGPASTVTRLMAAPDDPVRVWNQVTTEIGAEVGAGITNLVTVANEGTGIGLWIESRFNTANSSGTLRSTRYPGRATQDSLFGNTAEFGGLAGVNPVMRLTGLDPGASVDLRFFASRLSADDRRETLYRVEGATAEEVVLEVANNDNRVAELVGISAAPDGTIRIRLLPGMGNPNPNRFTYLGVLELVIREQIRTRPSLSGIRLIGDRLHFVVEGSELEGLGFETSPDLRMWTDAEDVRVESGVGAVSVAIGEGVGFVRAVGR